MKLLLTFNLVFIDASALEWVAVVSARGRDEISGLAHSFTRTRRSLGKAMTMLEGAP